MDILTVCVCLYVRWNDYLSRHTIHSTISRAIDIFFPLFVCLFFMADSWISLECGLMSKITEKKFILRAHQLIIIELWLCIVSILCSRSIPNHLLIHTNHVPVKKEPRKKEEIPCWLTINASHEKFNTPIRPFILPPEYNWKTSFNWCK